MASLEYGLKFEGISHRGSLPIKKWRNNLSKLIEKKNSVDNFITRSSIKLDNLATGEQLVNSLEILYGKGSTSRSKNTSYIQLVPKKGFDYNTWEHVNKILKANGFEWMTILEDESQSGHPNKFWEKWVEQIPEQDKI
jgi:hypothetical protein